MTGPTHALIGITATVALARSTGFVPDVPSFLLMLVGSLAPDIDGGGSISKPGKIFKVFLGWRIARFVDSIAQVVSKIIEKLFTHRGLVHAPLFALVLMFFGFYISKHWLFWFGWGYAWHLAGDFMTKGGIPLLAPFSKRRFSGGLMRTGSPIEWALAACLLLFCCVFGWPLLPDTARNAALELVDDLNSSGEVE